jgi:hypothetical protein
MALLAPPPLPRVRLGDDDRRRIDLRLWQALWTLVTLLVTVWFCTLGPIWAICAIMVAKHILVAILMLGLGVDAREEEAAALGSPFFNP